MFPLGHCIQQTFLVDEANQYKSFPVLFLSIQVRRKIEGVKVKNRGLWVNHQWLHCFGHVLFTGRREHRHKLLERQKRLSQLEVQFQVSNAMNIGHEWGVVRVKKPSPGRHSFEIVQQDPLQTFNVLPREVSDKFFRYIDEFELLNVVTPLVLQKFKVKDVITIIFIRIPVVHSSSVVGVVRLDRRCCSSSALRLITNTSLQHA
mmetsp:Transcript_28970/g.86939  ORF Transcript_28970/g.86939 Transcript_28970/m.86939 type:complete len:204 (+) Transcript_28970:2357-2968(+)